MILVEVSNDGSWRSQAADARGSAPQRPTHGRQASTHCRQ